LAEFIPIPSLSEIYMAYRTLKKREAERKWKDTLMKMSKARANPLLNRFLACIYSSHEILRVNGNIYPVALFPSPEEQWEEPESVLEKPLINVKTDFLQNILREGEDYLKVLKAAGAFLYESTGYRMVSLKSSPLKLTSAVGHYFDTLKTCDVLESELLRNFYDHTPRDDPKSFHNFLESHLKLRSELHNRVKDPVVDGSFRCAGIAISTLVLFNDNNDCYRFLICQRSRKVAVSTDFLHVIPSFMFEPTAGEPERIMEEYSVRHNIFREYLEEIFSVSEVEKPSGVTFDYFYNNPNLEYLRRLLVNRKAELLLAGVCVNLLNLRPEICALLVICSPEWFNIHRKGTKSLDVLKYNYEFKSVYEMEESKTVPISIPRVKEDLSFPDFLTPENIVPSGAAAIFLGLQVAKHRLNL